MDERRNKRSQHKMIMFFSSFIWAVSKHEGMMFVGCHKTFHDHLCSIGEHLESNNIDFTA